MKIQLHQRVSRDTDAAPDDVRILKKALNRLGYYIPDAARGITKIADSDMIDAVKKFQQANGLKTDGVVLPDGETARILNQKLAEPSTAKLEWHCVKNDNSCDTCEAFDSTIVDIDEFDTPGCDGICRCWVMPVMDYEAPDRIESVYPEWFLLSPLAGKTLSSAINIFRLGRKLSKREIKTHRYQLQKKFKHAKSLGITGNANNKTLDEFRIALQKHISSDDTSIIRGTYHGEKVTHYFNPKTGINVIKNELGEFKSAWKLSKKQTENMLKNGKLGGGK